MGHHRGQEIGASILQIATADHVLIFDLNTLGKTKSKAAVDLLQRFFASESIYKVHWAFENSDISEIKKSSYGNVNTIIHCNSNSF